MTQPVEDTRKIGRIISEKRKADGLTQARLAALSGVGVRFVGELERGKPTARLDKLFKVLDGLGLYLDVKKRGE
ncbi:helix-turn-helix transcriptional regulator [Desulfonatronospira sp. MSAO_Bac3]|uniref:helix-turn-helix transcriptional regulator n=1 Tax=Desulfonatronospira sp. MSAO_Bac3 TaxID=2293857 RepID=UPI000FF286D6|nr:helix-turn-helix transcriptional regulator [Desulfonatronospira sp. MSAO_Bac3]RQD74646.1 MAG: transcriptional regulator [Desulfonatronospira sp. MSAO_Bac3]